MAFGGAQNAGDGLAVVRVCVHALNYSKKLKQSFEWNIRLNLIDVNTLSKSILELRFRRPGRKEKFFQLRWISGGAVGHDFESVWNVGFINPTYVVAKYSFVSLFLAFHYKDQCVRPQTVTARIQSKPFCCKPTGRLNIKFQTACRFAYNRLGWYTIALRVHTR